MKKTQAQEKAMAFVRRQAEKAQRLALNMENALKWLEDGEDVTSVLYSVVNEIQNEFGRLDLTVFAIVKEHAKELSREDN